jgi:hypothetical protein
LSAFANKTLQARPQLRLVQAWTELHADELHADWDLAVNEYPLDGLVNKQSSAARQVAQGSTCERWGASGLVVVAA